MKGKKENGEDGRGSEERSGCGAQVGGEESERVRGNERKRTTRGMMQRLERQR